MLITKLDGPYSGSIDAKMAFSTSGDQSLFLGGITLRLQGGLTVDQGGQYTFNGTLKAYDDYYDFNRSTHRGLIGEGLTRYGSTVKGTPYWIEIRGSKPISESGKDSWW